MSDKYESSALPRLPDGRTYISDEMLAQDYTLQKILYRWHNSISYDALKQLWIIGSNCE